MNDTALDTDGWWSRPGGPRELLRLSLPLIVSTASWSVMTFIDRLFLHWWSPVAMGATLSASCLVWSLMAFPFGLIMYVNTFVAQYHGAGQPRRIGLALSQALRLSWLAAPLYVLFGLGASELFLGLGHEASLARQEADYFRILCYSVGGTLVSTAYSAFYTGRGETRVVMVIDFASAVLNVGLDYLWIFGHAGFPEWGIEGAAAATSVALWAKVLAYWLLLRSPKLRETYGLSTGNRWDAEMLRRLWRFGAPNGLQFLLEGSAFTVFTLFVGRFGATALAATTLAISVNLVAFVPMIGVATAVTTLVGQYQGALRPDRAARAGWTGLWIALAFNSVFAVLYWCTPDLFLAAHAAGHEDFGEHRDLTVLLLRFVAAYCLFDATQLICSFAVKGAGDTRFVLLTTVVTSGGCVGLGVAGMWWWNGELLWWWSVLLLWLVSLAVAYGLRFASGKWRSMRVIEPEFS